MCFFRSESLTAGAKQKRHTTRIAHDAPRWEAVHVLPVPRWGAAARFRRRSAHFVGRSTVVRPGLPEAENGANEVCLSLRSTGAMCMRGAWFYVSLESNYFILAI